MSLPAQAREMMAGAYASRETVERAIDNMLTAKPLPKEDREQVVTDSLRGAPPAKIAWPRATSLEDITEQVGSISVPTTVIAGELDRVDTVETLKRELLPLVPQAVMHVVPGTGHLSMLESPAEVSRLIADFVAEESETQVTSTKKEQDTFAKLEQVTFTKKEPPQWLLDMWKEFDDKTFGKGFDCFTEDAVCNLGVADWKGREAIRTSLKAFIDTGFTARHHVTEYWDAGFLKVFRGVVDMTPDDRSRPTIHPASASERMDRSQT